MIVYVTMNGYDKDCAIQAEPRSNGLIMVPGHQLYVVASERYRPMINKYALYPVGPNGYKRKVYDCVTMNPLVVRIHNPQVDCKTIIRVRDYHPSDGCPGFDPQDLIDLGFNEVIVGYHDRYSDDGLCYLKTSAVRFC